MGNPVNPVLEIDQLHLCFHGREGTVDAVRGVSLSIFPGETVALVGESGSGKTALCRAILMLHARHASIPQGAIRLLGRDVTQLSERELEALRGKAAAMILQEPHASLDPVIPVGKQLVEVLRHHRGNSLSAEAAKAEALALLERVGLPEPARWFNQYPLGFSGGMAQRAAIAMALAGKPSLLIADEPTTSLDGDTEAQVVEVLRGLKAQGMPLLLVTHDLGLARSLADRVAVMQQGKIVETGDCQTVFDHPQHPYTQRLVRYAQYGREGSHFHGERFASPDRQPVLRGEALSKAYEDHQVLSQLSFSLGKGEVLGLVGPSGCGKSTLARCLIGLETPDSGTVQVAEGCKVQMIFQDALQAMSPRMKLVDIISEPLAVQRVPRQERRQQALALMDAVGLSRDLALRHSYQLSGGERQRAAIARALISQPDILIADEPIASLDVSIQADIVHLLRELCTDRGLSMLFICHDLPMVEHISDRVLHLDRKP